MKSCPDTHQQNGIAERTVDLIKTTSRTNDLATGLNDHLLDYSHKYAAVQLSRTPMDASKVSSLSIWPHAPFQHPSLDLAPFGCLAYGHMGKDPQDPNHGSRATPGIFLGHDPIACGYRIYRSDSSQVKVYAYATFNIHSFPFLTQQLIGKRPGTIMDNNWRQHAISLYRMVPNHAAANYFVGKQLEFEISRSWYPTYSLTWRAHAQAVLTSSASNNSDLVGQEVVLAHYNGHPSTLSAQDRQLLNSTRVESLVIPMSPLKTGQTLLACWHSGPEAPNVRSLLKWSYPDAKTLADLTYALLCLQ
mmetsp:Transcript_18411/g.44232  ORF Transcript_18411/g.44232 Transcript_18411/m.44232 type:complete len:304 (-) Transcript_18411:463-1374(-)